tara:strand:+ start:194 stop:4669 length:4476 start_codon:yes stop_codon:yes gene_type:complete
MPLNRFTNIEEIESKQPAFGDVFTSQDLALISEGATYPQLDSEDVTGIDGITSPSLEVHYYTPQGAYLGGKTNSPITIVGDAGSKTIFVRPGQDIREAGYTSGTYKLVYNFLHQAASGLKITEISPNRKEVKIQSNNINGLTNLYQLYSRPNNLVGNTFSGDDTFLPAQLNFGGNQLYPIVNAAFMGQRGGQYGAILPFPVGDASVQDNNRNTIFVPVTQGPLEGGFGDDNTTPFVTFAEIDLDDTIQGGVSFFPITKYRLTGIFDRFKLRRNADTSLSWLRKNEVYTTPEELPSDVDASTRNAMLEPTYTTVNINSLEVNYNAMDLNLNTVNEVIVKLNQELPSTVNVNDSLEISLELHKPYVENIILYEALEDPNQIPFFSNPNFNIDLGENKGAAGEFESWDSLLDAGLPTKQQIVDKFFSGSLGNVKLNIDYSDLQNYIHFSSAEERVRNFKYKLQLVEGYNARITTLTGVSGSEAITNISASTNRRDALIGGFDDFEYWLYYNHESSLYTHFSSSEYRIDPYPKELKNPHTLYDLTSSQGTNWFNNTIETARTYDAFNDSKLTEMIPSNLAFDEKNEEYVEFVKMLGQHFDIFYNYIQEITQINDREEHPKDGMAQDLIEVIANSFGWKLFNGYSDTSLWTYEFGVSQEGNPIQSGSLYSKPTKEIVHETWRRLLNNVPGIYKSKGTARSFKTLISSYGIPSAFLKIREYGGPRIKDTKEIYEHERYIYKLQLDGLTNGEHPWDVINGSRPKTIEIIAKLPQGNHTIMRHPNFSGTAKVYDLMWEYNQLTGKARWVVKENNLETVATTPYVPYKQERNVVVAISSGSGGYTLNSAWVDDFGFTLANPTASWTTGSLDHCWSGVGGGAYGLAIPYVNVGSDTTSSVQEVRYYKKQLSNEVILGHAANTDAYYSDDNTTDLDIDTSYENLLYRIFPDSTYNNISGSILSRHPNQQFTASATGLILSASFDRTNRADPARLSGEVDTQFVSIPSVGALNLTNKKVRIESSSLRGPLQFDRSNEISQYDEAPLDSNLLGTYFSTTDTINFDIYASEGYFDAGDLVGDTDVRNNDGYDLLDFRARNYFQKYTGRTALQIQLDMLSRYDMSIFDSMKQLVPARADWHKGILIEPHIFERNNYLRPQGISFTQNQYESSGIATLNIISGSYLTYTSSITKDAFKPSVYKYTDIQRLSSSGDYFTDTNPYWEYSPTGSTILDARLSKTALEPKYFYSNDISASKGPEFASSASFHFARVQDDRLTGGLLNLYYNGCSISSTSLTANSPDTPDNTPVIEVSIVNDTKLVMNTTKDIDLESGGKDPKVIGIIPSEDLLSVQKYIDKNEAPNLSISKGVDKQIEDDLFRNPPALPLLPRTRKRPIGRIAGGDKTISFDFIPSIGNTRKNVTLNVDATNSVLNNAVRKQMRRQYRSGGLGSNTMGGNVSNVGFGVGPRSSRSNTATFGALNTSRGSSSDINQNRRKNQRGGIFTNRGT